MNITVKHTAPTVEQRDEQPYVAIRTQVPMQELSAVIPQLIDETEAWLKTQGIAPTGAPLARYHVINMDDMLDIEIGWPVAERVAGNDRITSSTLPAGRYGTLIYTDVSKGIEGNGALIVWAEEQGLKLDAWDTDKGHAFRSRVEVFIDGPDDDPDPANWRTEVAIKLADN